MLAGNRITPWTCTIAFSPPATTQLHLMPTILNQEHPTPFSPAEPIALLYT